MVLKGTTYLVSSFLVSSLDTRAWRHLNAKSGDFFRAASVSSGLSLKKTGTGPRQVLRYYQNFLFVVEWTFEGVFLFLST